MKMYFVYILKCSDNLLYVGITNNIERRPLELIFHQIFNDVEQVIYFEKKIKKWSGKKKLALANDDFDMIEILSECRNTTHHKYNPDK
ncbi:GIY-YIG nuclease family protein [uncultured Polaribacter sp.]|uniref:GIY-YIG nuclease family protein n=1 Tax=uncultured Polaribacter sp. TaxID=174711 RepID=UPI0026196F31|nr:GIY-YIG nuclease family protein [uncultured Polaribacter sp.]